MQLAGDIGLLRVVQRRDGHERADRQTAQLIVEHRAIPLDDSSLLQLLHAGLHRGHRQAGQPGQLSQRGPPVLLQRIEDGLVRGVEHGGALRPDLHLARCRVRFLVIARIRLCHHVLPGHTVRRNLHVERFRRELV